VPNFPKKAWFYIVGIIVLGAGLAAWQLWGLELSRSFLLAWAILAVLDLLCELYEIELIPGHAASAAIAVGVGADTYWRTKAWYFGSFSEFTFG
jgi:uncharacterized membrane protein